jgi:hypothetical protein
MDYIEQQFLLYRNTRKRVREHLQQIKNAGFEKVSIRGEGDVADVCRLSCLEQGMSFTSDDNVPILEIVGLKVVLHLDDSHE